MNIAVEYIDQSGTTHNQTHRLTRLTFAKHLAVAGQGYAPKPQKPLKEWKALINIYSNTYHII